MGKDSPLAVLSDQAPSLFRYFHQLFAQVTNPPIDPHREALVMSLATATGPDGNTLEETPDQCHRLTLPGPILTNGQLADWAEPPRGDVPSPAARRRCSTWTPARARSSPRSSGSASRRWTRWTRAAASSSSATAGWTPGALPSRRCSPLSAVHQRLTRDGIRMQTGLLVETGEAREVHHFAALFGFGAAAVNPYLALDTVRALADSGEIAARRDTRRRPATSRRSRRGCSR